MGWLSTVQRSRTSRFTDHQVCAVIDAHVSAEACPLALHGRADVITQPTAQTGHRDTEAEEHGAAVPGHEGGVVTPNTPQTQGERSNTEGRGEISNNQHTLDCCFCSNRN